MICHRWEPGSTSWSGLRSQRTSVRSHVSADVADDRISVFGTSESSMVKLNIFLASFFRASTNWRYCGFCGSRYVNTFTLWAQNINNTVHRSVKHVSLCDLQVQHRHWTIFRNTHSGTFGENKTQDLVHVLQGSLVIQTTSKRFCFKTVPDELFSSAFGNNLLQLSHASRDRSRTPCVVNRLQLVA